MAIQFFDEEQVQATVNEIQFCEESYGEIVFCEEEEIPPLYLTGTDEPVSGSEYTASGGVPPYSFTIDCGSISNSGDNAVGVVSGISSCCGVGYVRVTDNANQVAQIDIKHANGSYQNQELYYETPVDSSAHIWDYEYWDYVTCYIELGIYAYTVHKVCPMCGDCAAIGDSDMGMIPCDPTFTWCPGSYVGYWVQRRTWAC